MAKRKPNPLAYKHRARARERMDRGYKLAHSGYMAEARRELELARDDFNDGREPKVHARLGRVLALDDDNLQAQAASYLSDKNAFPWGEPTKWGVRRRENVDPATAAAITGAIGATTMTTIQTMADNPSTRFTVAQVGPEVVVVKGMRKGAALNAAEAAVGAPARRDTALTFDTRHEAYAYAEAELGPVTRDLGVVDNPAEVRAIKRRVLR